MVFGQDDEEVCFVINPFRKRKIRHWFESFIIAPSLVIDERPRVPAGLYLRFTPVGTPMHLDLEDFFVSSRLADICFLLSRNVGGRYGVTAGVWQ